MFRKLVSNLPFNPSLIKQFAFYTKRLKKEESFRRLGFIVTALAIMVQTFAIMVPPKPTLANSDSNIISGGISPYDSNGKLSESSAKSRLKSIFASGKDGVHSDIRQVYTLFGVDESSINNSKLVWASSADRGKNLWVIGRHNRTGQDVKILTTADSDIFYRNWYKAWGGEYGRWTLKGTNSQGKEFWIILVCGNLVTDGKWPLEPKPELSIRKELISPSPAKVGSEVRFKISYANTGNGFAGDVKITDVLPSEMSFVRLEPDKDPAVSGKVIVFRHENNAYFSLPPKSVGEVVLVAKLDKQSTIPVCNKATISDASGTSKTAQACVEVYQPQPDAICTALQKTFTSRNELAFTALAEPKEGAVISGYVFNFGDNSQAVTVSTSSTTANANHTYAKPGQYQAIVTVNTSVGAKTSDQCKQTVTIKEPDGTPLTGLDKSVTNLTKGIFGKTRLAAGGGDELEYTLTAKNVGDATEKSFIMPGEDLSDVLDYATITSISDGGVLNKATKQVSWSDPIDIPAGATIKRIIKAKVVSPIPTTTPSTSDPNTFDLKMVNVYGERTVVVDLEKPIVNKVVTTTNSIPRTGPATNTALMCLVMAIIGYFFSRSRLLAKEAELIKNEFNGVGI